MELIDFARYIGALLLVLGLLGCAWLATRRYGLPGIVQARSERRLAVTETLTIGPRHKLLIIKRDGTEHLVLMGPQGGVVIEAGIAAQAAKGVHAAAVSAPTGTVGTAA